MTNPNKKRFKFCPFCGKPELEASSIKSFECNACGFTFFNNCAAAAMAVIENPEGSLLVTIRNREPYKWCLDLPGGFAEPGESIEQCLKREIKEELDLDITHLSYLCSSPNTYPYKTVIYPITDIAFICQVKTFSTICARDDISGYRFIPENELHADLFEMESPKNVIQYYLKQKTTGLHNGRAGGSQLKNP